MQKTKALRVMGRLYLSAATEHVLTGFSEKQSAGLVFPPGA